jgi:hypothetical protein
MLTRGESNHRDPRPLAGDLTPVNTSISERADSDYCVACNCQNIKGDPLGSSGEPRNPDVVTSGGVASLHGCRFEF